MNRTGIEQSDTPKIIALAQAVTAAGLKFRGLHYYDGQYGNLDEPERTQATHRGYDHLLKIASDLDRSGIGVPEIITAGTPTFPCSLSYERFRHGNFIHRVSPGTIVYCDATSLHQLPLQYGYRPAALVLTRVVSHPHPGIVTCDAGHKTVSADAGIPTCLALGHPELTPLSPSEEHLPMAVKPGPPPPRIGEALYLLPRHICPTVNNFNDALLVRAANIESTEEVSARGREAPLLHSQLEASSLRGRYG
jgi:D-serine deaminase-like pyridoxal phosphate-dependent protein